MIVKDKKRKLSKEELDEVLKDWFVRDKKTFVKATDKNRLEWEKTIGKGAAYSEYILKSPTVEQLFKEGYYIAKSTLTAMLLPVPVSISIGGQQSKTDGKTIFVATDVFDDRDLTAGEKLDVFLGFTVHEGLHIKYTDFVETSGVTNKTLFDIYNVVEDERIETLNGEEFPGFSRFLEKTKNWVFDKKAKEEKIDFSKMNDVERILMIFIYLIRYPANLKEDDFGLLGDYLLRIKDVLFPYPKSTKGALEAAEKVYAILKELLAEKEKEKNDDSGGKAGEGTDEEGGGKIKITEADLDKIEEMLNKPMKGSMLEKIMALLGEIAEGLKEIPEGTSAITETASFIKRDKDLLKELEHIIERPACKKLYIEKQDDNRFGYEKALQEVQKYIPAVRRHLMGHSRDYKLVHKSMRSGHLDTTKLAEARQLVQTVYIKEGWVKTDKVNLVLLIDESGSMIGPKAEQAKKAAILIKEALRGVPNVNLFIYGHSADIHGSAVTDLYVYYEPGYMPKYALGGVRGRSENRDGEAIMYAAERVRKFSQEKTLMFVLSDGYPAYRELGLTGSVEATRNAVTFVQKRGWRVVQIAIEHSFDPKTMFDHFLILDNLSSLANNLGKVVKKAVEKFSTIRVS